MSKRVRAVIVKDGNLLMVKRFSNGETFFVFPGGGVIDEETDEAALIRECLEELNVFVKVGDFFFQQMFNDNAEFFYLCDVVGGEMGIGNGQEYTNMKSDNTYAPVWLAMSEIEKINIKPPTIIDKIINYSLLRI